MKDVDDTTVIAKRIKDPGDADRSHRVAPPTDPLTRRPRLPTAAILRTALPVTLFVVAWVTTPEFATGHNLSNIVRQVSVTGIVAVGLTFITLSGNFFALSTAATAAFSALCFVKLIDAGTPDILALIAALAVGSAVGAVQGVVVACKGNPIVVSLATAAALGGLVSIISHGVSVRWTSNLGWLSAKYAATSAMAVIAVVGAVVLRYTPTGRRLILSGSNRFAAANAGINVGLSAVLAFTVFGLACALAGILQAGRFGEVVASNYTELDLAGVAAVLIGGTVVSGGSGSPWRSLMGALFVSLLTNVAILNGWGPGWREMFVGLSVVFVVAAFAAVRRFPAGRGASR
jgi:simple sugar transport system permease protein/ribose transport system permease protein